MLAKQANWLFGKHLVFECKQHSCGVLLYRCGADLGVCLSKILKFLHGTTNSVINYQPQCQEPATEQQQSSTFDEEQLQVDIFCAKMNGNTHKQSKLITDADANCPYDVFQFDVEATIASIDPLLWWMIVFLTRSVS